MSASREQGLGDDIGQKRKTGNIILLLSDSDLSDDDIGPVKKQAKVKNEAPSRRNEKVAPSMSPERACVKREKVAVISEKSETKPKPKISRHGRRNNFQVKAEAKEGTKDPERSLRPRRKRKPTQRLGNFVELVDSDAEASSPEASKAEYLSGEETEPYNPCESAAEDTDDGEDEAFECDIVDLKNSALDGQRGRNRKTRQKRNVVNSDDESVGSCHSMPPLEDPFEDEPEIEVQKIKFCEDDVEKAREEHKDENSIVLEYKSKATHATFEDTKDTVVLKSHPAKAVISSAFLGTPAPDYRDVKLSQKLLNALKKGDLSNLQHEGVCRTIRSWWGNAAMGTGWRRGFLLGDQTGMGKGRQIAACIAHNWYQRGIRKALWLSKSPVLVQDARRDFAALGLDIPVYEAKEVRKKNKIVLHEGVVFSSYSFLSNKHFNKSEMIIKWMKDKGTIVFDECHLLKNMVQQGDKASGAKVHNVPAYFKRLLEFKDGVPPDKLIESILCERNTGTKTGIASFLIQHLLPEACVLYASATSFSCVRNIAPMARLGLWGPGTPFKSFYEFKRAVVPNRKAKNHPGEIPMMEIVGRDLYARGLYVARMVSYEDVIFKVEDVKLSPNFKATYDRAVALQWAILHEVQIAEREKRLLKKRKGVYWSMNQRFFKALTCAGKLQQTVGITKEFLKQGFAVVISLWGTGEARTKELYDERGVDVSECLNIAEEMARHFINTTFCEENCVNDPCTKSHIARVRKELLRKVDEAKLNCLYNPIDYLKAKLGGFKEVAEVTGREKHWVNTKRGRRWEKRKQDWGGEDIKIQEANQFQAGRKKVAIISEAGSTGISLHASKKNPDEGQRPRINIVLEFPWAADSALQQMGRVHRTDQKSPPRFLILVTELGGERRFVSAVTKRLESLGALTRGDRSASFAGGDQVEGQSVFEEMNWQNDFGQAALRLLGKNLGFHVKQQKGWWHRNERDIADIEEHRADEKANDMVAGDAREMILPCIEQKEVKSELDLHVGEDFLKFIPEVSRNALASACGMAYFEGSKTEILNQKAQLILSNLIIEGLGGGEIFGDFTKFANRILNLPFMWQQRIFDTFLELYKAAVDEARANGTYVPGVQDMKALGAKSIEFVERSDAFTNSRDRSKTELVKIRADYGLSFEGAKSLLLERRRLLHEIRGESGEVPNETVDSEEEIGYDDRFVVEDDYDDEEMAKIARKNKGSVHGDFDGFYSWVPRSLHKRNQRREVVLLLENLPLRAQLKKKSAQIFRRRAKHRITFRVIVPHKQPSKCWRPMSIKKSYSRDSVTLLALMKEFADSDTNEFHPHRIKRHKDFNEVKELWDNQFRQANTQAKGPSHAQCAQCEMCREPGSKLQCRDPIKLSKRIVSHNLLTGNIMQIWDDVKVALKERKYNKHDALQVLRCSINGGVFVGVDVPTECIEKLQALLNEKEGDVTIKPPQQDEAAPVVATESTKFERKPMQYLASDNSMPLNLPLPQLGNYTRRKEQLPKYAKKLEKIIQEARSCV